MLAVDLFNLKPGTFVKGFDIHDSNRWEGRKAFLNTEGWSNKSNQNFTVIRTMLSFSNKNTLFLSGDECIDATNKDHTWSDFCWRDGSRSQIDVLFQNPVFLSFKFGDPIGIHLGQFVLSKQQSYTIYSRMLLCSGEVGLIGVSSERINQPFDLI
jgi:hypothetical protein